MTKKKKLLIIIVSIVVGLAILYNFTSWLLKPSQSRKQGWIKIKKGDIWESYRCNSKNNSYYNKNLNPMYYILWQHIIPPDINSIMDIAVINTPAVGIEKSIVFAGYQQKLISAFEPRTGKKLWEKETYGGVKYSPVYYKEKNSVIVVFSKEDKQIVSYSVEDGKELWISSNYGRAIRGNPAIYKNFIYIPFYDIISEKYTITIINADTGKYIGDVVFSQKISSPTVDDSGFLYLSMNKTYYGFKIDNGIPKLKWKKSLNGISRSTALCLYNGVIYDMNGNTIISIRAKTGNILWRKKMPSLTSLKGGISSDGKRIYFAATDLSYIALNRLIAIDIKTQKLVWEYIMRDYIEPPIITKSNVLIPSGIRSLVILEVKTGKFEKEFFFDDLLNPISFIGNLLILSCKKGYIYTLVEKN